ncbi:hypothetical protein Bca101_058716 [Brassica carinata]
MSTSAKKLLLKLNSAMGDALSQLKTIDTLNGAALRTDEVEPNLNDSWFHRDIVFDVQNGGFVAEEEHQLLNKPNHVSKPEEGDNQCGKAWLLAGETSIVRQRIFDLNCEVCKARHACGGDKDNDFCRNFREDVGWKAPSKAEDSNEG